MSPMGKRFLEIVRFDGARMVWTWGELVPITAAEMVYCKLLCQYSLFPGNKDVN